MDVLWKDYRGSNTLQSLIPNRESLASGWFQHPQHDAQASESNFQITSLHVLKLHTCDFVAEFVRILAASSLQSV